MHRTKDEIDAEIARAQDIADADQPNSGVHGAMNAAYAQGVVDALEWATCSSEAAPIDTLPPLREVG